MRTKLLLELQYLGGRYCGWQSQPGEGTSIADVLSEALRSAGIAGGPVASGRTDKGVHAMQQLVTVTVRVRPGAENDDVQGLCELLNAQLPEDVHVRSVARVPPKAHALTGSGPKTYSYFVMHGTGASECEGLWDQACWILARTLDIAAMGRAAARLATLDDLRALSSANATDGTARSLIALRLHEPAHARFPLLGCYCERQLAPQPAGTCQVCTVDEQRSGSSTVRQQCQGGVDYDRPSSLHGQLGAGVEAPPSLARRKMLQLQFVADGFLRHQVRRMVGYLIRVGLGEEADEAPLRGEQAAAFDRRRAPKAPAQGLWLEAVEIGTLLGSEATQT